MKKILIVDDDISVRSILKDIVEDKGYKAIEVENGEKALQIIEDKHPHIIFLDINMPGISGIEVLKRIKKMTPAFNGAIIVITGYGDIKSAVESMKLGAFDFMTKPFGVNEIILAVKKATRLFELTNEVKVLKEKLEEKEKEKVLVGKSLQIEKVLKRVELVAPSDMSVIIQGESGTGKEIVASMIKSKSSRKSKPFIAVDCGAIPDTLFESELFGYEKGAFTGANKTKKGKFELANQGTLLLDEISNLPKKDQAKLLRAIEEREINRVGGAESIKIDVRLIVTSNVDLSEAVKRGLFRKDLYHRLNEICISLPPLKERGNDVILLAEKFLLESKKELNKDIQDFTPQAIKKLLAHNWPGNVRELKHTIKRAVLIENMDEIHPDSISFDNSEFPMNNQQEDFNNYAEMVLNNGLSLQDVIQMVNKSVEKQVIEKISIEVKYNKSEMAKKLGIDRKTLYNKMEKLDIDL
jgi:DNA-binding NtrC family response regulator